MEKGKIEPVVRLPGGSFFDLREIATVHKPPGTEMTHVVTKGMYGTTFYLEGEDAEALYEAMNAYHFGIEFKKERN